MIRAHDFIHDDHILNPWHQAFADQKIIQAPTNILLAGMHAVGPPCVAHRIRVKMPENIHQTMREVFIYPYAFFG